jgi:hypothetical protein
MAFFALGLIMGLNVEPSLLCFGCFNPAIAAKGLNLEAEGFL